MAVRCEISVVIPTRNRFPSLRRTLDALGGQSFPREQVEVIVVADGCTDATREGLTRYGAPFPLRVVEQPARGAAVARNRGAAEAGGRLLVFLDDDVEPGPQLLAAHARAHRGLPDQVVIGPYLPVREGPVDFLSTLTRAAWSDLFHAMSRPDHRWRFVDLAAGNVSLSAELFARVGGFDPAFAGCGREDYEFGARLIKAGVPFAFVADAAARHHEHETMSLGRKLQRARLEGRNDVILGRRHPDLRSVLPLADVRGLPFTFLGRRLRSLAFRRPTVGDLLAGAVRRLLGMLEGLRLRWRWRQYFFELNGYWYLRGVLGELGPQQSLDAFLAEGSGSAGQHGPEIEIDLRDGLGAAERRLDAVRPGSVRALYGSQEVGRIPPRPGAERLRGCHMRRLLASELARPLYTALARAGALGLWVTPSLTPQDRPRIAA
jgi:GT2 family glycosyltransferase